MSLVVKEKGKNIPPLESGVYTGICVGVVDLGEQKNERFGKYQDRVAFFFEITGEFVDVGEGELKPRWLSKEFTASLNERSNLAKTLQSWRSRPFSADELKGFDLSQLVGQGCQLQVMENEKNDRVYNTIEQIMGLPKGVAASEPISETFVFDMGKLEQAEAVFPKLPEWVQKRVEKSTTWTDLHQNIEPLDVRLDEVGREVPLQEEIQAPF